LIPQVQADQKDQYYQRVLLVPLVQLDLVCLGYHSVQRDRLPLHLQQVLGIQPALRVLVTQRVQCYPVDLVDHLVLWIPGGLRLR